MATGGQIRKRSYDRLESALQRKIIDFLEGEGWVVIKLIQTNLNGITDLLLLKKGRSVFLEVKRPGKQPDPLQEYRMKQLNDAGFTATWTHSWTHFLTTYNVIKQC